MNNVSCRENIRSPRGIMGRSGRAVDGGWCMMRNMSTKIPALESIQSLKRRPPSAGPEEKVRWMSLPHAYGESVVTPIGTTHRIATHKTLCLLYS